MRISDDRYSRDRFRLDLALRFMRHEARTHTIRKWTGLTDDRIRKLYKAYLEQTPGQHPVYRHRGKSPAQACYFIRTPRVQQESAVLASLYCMLGALPASPETEPPTPGVVRGERLCQAFEAYLTFVQSAPSPSSTRCCSSTSSRAASRSSWTIARSAAGSSWSTASPCGTSDAAAARNSHKPAARIAASWIQTDTDPIFSPARISTAAPSCARRRTGSPPRVRTPARSTW